MTDRIDDRLRRHAAAWQRSLPPSTMDVASLGGRRSPPWLAAVAAAALVLAIVLAGVALHAGRQSDHPVSPGDVVPWKALPPTHPRLPSRLLPASPSPHYADGAPPCRDGDVRVAVDPRGGGGAAGTGFTGIVVSTTGRRTCRMDGFPRVRTTYRGHTVAVRHGHYEYGYGWHTAVLVGPGHSAVFSLAYVEIQWCSPIDTVLFTLPGLTHPLAIRKRFERFACESPRADYVGASRLVPRGYREARRTSPWDAVVVSGRIPRVVEPREPVRFTVTLTSPKDLALTPCPDLLVGYYGKPAVRTVEHGLNCADVPYRRHGEPYLPAGVPVRFATEAPAPTDPVAKAIWRLQGTSLAIGGPITIKRQAG